VAVAAYDGHGARSNPRKAHPVKLNTPNGGTVEVDDDRGEILLTRFGYTRAKAAPTAHPAAHVPKPKP